MMRESFPKEERVRKGRTFTLILENGERVRGRFVTAYWLADAENPSAPNRVGIAAGKRLGPAVLRNRLKRRMREAFRRNKRELSCRGMLMVLIASRSMIGRSQPEIQEDVIGLLRAIGR